MTPGGRKRTASGLRRVEPVARSADRDHVDRPAGILLDLGPQPTDVDVDGARAAGVGRTPDPRHELVAAEHAAGIAGERRQEGELLRAEMDLDVVPPNPTADQVELDVRCDRDMASRIRPEPAWIDQEMRATGELDGIDGRRQGLVEPEGERVETSGDISGLVEEDEAEGRPLTPLGNGGEQPH